VSPELAFTFPLKGGLHARPAAALRERALTSGLPVDLVNDRSGKTALLGNLLSLLATDTRRGDPCRLRAEGAGAGAALADLAAFLGGAFLLTDMPGEAPAARGRAGTALTRVLAGAPFVEGFPIAPGVGMGPAFPVRPAWTGVDLSPSLDPERERADLTRALDRSGAALRAQCAQAAGHPARKAILEAQAAMLLDATWVAAMEAALRSGSRAPAAVVQALAEARAGLLASDSPYLRERALDLTDLGDRLLAELGGAEVPPLPLPGPCVVVATELTPSQFLALDRDLVRGLVLTGGSTTSHTSILARSFGIPCVLCPEAPAFQAGVSLTVDGDRGLVIPGPPLALDAYYAIQARERNRSAESGPAFTADGIPLALHANILSSAEAPGAFRLGAEGIGLFRSELLFLDRETPPSEQEQYEAYRTVLEAAQGRPVVLRLLDVGGDKPLPYLPLAREANPFLGRRGVRWYALHPELVRTQLRAAARAARHGDLRLMIPMVAEVEEIRLVRAMLREATADSIPLGIMVEVPAAALNLAALGREAAFLCVGTNDLVQYLFAADRGDAQVASPSHDWHPATLRVLARIALDAVQAQRPLSLCGEMAGRPGLLPLLVGLGFRSLSLAPTLLAEARRTLAGLASDRCRTLADRALAMGTAAEVEELLRAGAGDRSGTLTDPDLVLLDAPCATKEEAIKLLAERCAALGRARDPLALEEALWARELAYTTGVGFGFAVPHCKSAEVLTPSLAVLRLSRPLAWGGLDDEPVDCAILLATRGDDGGDDHLRVFARLARKLMDETFRADLRQAPTPDAILSVLTAHILPQEPPCAP
jgi:fructose-specific PTS system IIA-like component